MPIRLYFGSDHAAVELREELAAHAREAGHEVAQVFGPTAADDKVDYPDVAAQVCARLSAEPGSLGVLVCGTGQGMAIAANRIAGIRAGVCADGFSAQMIRAHNDANVLCLGARVIGAGLATTVFDAFMAATFEGGRHQRRVDKITALEG